MKLQKKLLDIVRIYDKRTIVLWGFYINFFLVMTIAMVVDHLTGNTVDTDIEAVFLGLTIISFALYRMTGSAKLGIYGIVILATLTTYFLLVSNDFNVSIFHVIVPLGYFILFSLRHSLLFVAIHEAIVITLYTYAHYHYPNVPAVQEISLMMPIILASLMVILFGVVYHIAVENSYRLLTQANVRQEILLQEIHHRVKNNLNIISSLLGLQQLEQTDPVVHEMLRKNRLRINSIASVHEILYQQGDFEEIDLHDYLHEIAQQVIGMYDCDAQVTITNEQIKWPFAYVLKLGIITNELIINSIKHAFTEHRGQIEITLETGEEVMTYRYQDSGDTPVDKTTLDGSEGLGHHLISIMVEEMGASIQTTTKGGLAYAITIPYG